MKNTAKMLAETWLGIGPESGDLVELPRIEKLFYKQLIDPAVLPDGGPLPSVKRHSAITAIKIDDRLNLN